MRNLELVESIFLPCCTLLDDPRCLTVDMDTGKVWIVDRKGLFSLSTVDKVRACFFLLAYTAHEGSAYNTICACIPLLLFHLMHARYWQKEFFPVISICNSGQVAPDARFVGVQYVPDTEIICIAVSTGEVVTFSVVTNEVCEREGRHMTRTNTKISFNRGVCSFLQGYLNTSLIRRQ